MTGATNVTGQQRLTPELQGERARPHLAKARRKFCDSPSQFCNELTYLLASARCSAIVRPGVTLSTGIRWTLVQGRTLGGRAWLSNGAMRRADWVSSSSAALPRSADEHGIHWPTSLSEIAETIV